MDGLGSEGLDVLKIGVMLAFLSVTLSYVIYGISIGKGLGNNMYEKMAEAETNVNITELQDLSYSEFEVLPSAAVYSLIQYNANDIYDITCYICDNTHGKHSIISNGQPCLLDHLQGKVTLVTKFDEMLGQYHLFVYPYSFTINFNANGGSGHMASQEFVYDNYNNSSYQGQPLTKNSFYKQGATFAGWSITKDGSITYLDGQKVKNLLLFGEMNLYAIWR